MSRHVAPMVNFFYLLVFTLAAATIAPPGTTQGQSASAPPPSGARVFPRHWGQPPLRQTRDYVLLPGGFGRGSSTLARWIQSHLDQDARQAATNAGQDGDGSVTISGDLMQWHKVTLTLQGPYASETDTEPNPFCDVNFSVRFQHASGSPVYDVPGYFAADGNAAHTSAQAGTAWRAHLSPDKPGQWTYVVSFLEGKDVSVGHVSGGTAREAYHGKSGSFEVAPTDKTGRDFRATGRLQYVGQRYLRFQGNGQFFLKMGPDAPETLLAYQDFDGTETHNEKVPLKSWQPHVQDWNPGDPTWGDDKGKGLIGALNYLAQKGANSFSFLPYNAGGDGDNVWPFVTRNDKLHYDCSKLDQWGIVLDHANQLGLYQHFKLQENEMDDDRVGHAKEGRRVPESLDGGKLGRERMLYCRELIARFAHGLALNWNLGEENTQSTSEIQQMSAYLREIDPYDHHIVVHTFPNQQDQVYKPLLGEQSVLTGVSLQNPWNVAHQRTLHWLLQSQEAGKIWVCAQDEQNPASMGVPPDPGYAGHDGTATMGDVKYTLDDIRKYCLWGTLLAGGAGVEYYFGYELPQNDLVCEDFRSRDRSWDYGRLAINFFHEHQLPFWDMDCSDALVGNPRHDNSRYCLAKPGDVYVIYLPQGDAVQLDLANHSGEFHVHWFNPRTGGPLRTGSVTTVQGGSGRVELGHPPQDREQDWTILVRKSS